MLRASVIAVLVVACAGAAQRARAGEDLAVLSRHGLFRVDPATGDRRLLSGRTPVHDVAQAPDGGILTITADEPAVAAIDPDTGERRIVAGPGVGSGTDLEQLSALALEPDGKLAVLQSTGFRCDSGSPGPWSVLRVDRDTGARSVVSSLDVEAERLRGIARISPWAATARSTSRTRRR